MTQLSQRYISCRHKSFGVFWWEKQYFMCNMNYCKKTPFCVIWKHQLPHWSPDGDQILLCKASYSVLCQGHNSTRRSFQHFAQPLLWSVTNHYQSTCFYTSVLAILSWSAWPLEMKTQCFFETLGANAPVAQHLNREDLYCNYCSECLRTCEHRIDKDAGASLSITVLMSLVMWVEKYSEVTHCVYVLFLCSSFAEFWLK